jgi:NDP-sugar pyrophosphorylase family protein
MGKLTDSLPKPLLPLAGVPLLGHVARRLAEAGADEVLINLHYRAEQIQSYLAGLDMGLPVRSRLEPVLSGPAGALRLFQAELQRYDVVLVSSGDVIVGESLSRLVAAHIARPGPFTFGCTRVTGARRYGVLDIDDADNITGAREKPDVPDNEPHWVSAGVYCLDPWVIDRITPGVVQDYARDLAPALLRDGHRVGGYRLTGYWRDIGTPEALDAAEEDVAKGRVPWLVTNQC